MASSEKDDGKGDKREKEKTPAQRERLRKLAEAMVESYRASTEDPEGEWRRRSERLERIAPVRTRKGGK